jgi:hypothetical protein
MVKERAGAIGERDIVKTEQQDKYRWSEKVGKIAD